MFSGRYKAPLVDGSGTGYLRRAAEYVHLNPVRARLLQDEHPLSAYPWSSYPAYLRVARPPWLRVDRVLYKGAVLLSAMFCQTRVAAVRRLPAPLLRTQTS